MSVRLVPRAVGCRSLRTFSTSSNTPNAPLPAHEYWLRVGRAADVLEKTLPAFLSVGLVDYPDLVKERHKPPPSSGKSWISLPQLPQLADGILAPLSESAEPGESIYHPSIQFLLRPPLGSDESVSQALAEQHQTHVRPIHFSGRALYLTSSQVLRTALNALFLRPTIVLDQIRLQPSDEGDQLVVRLRLLGQLRLVRTPHEYTVVFKYTFHRPTGQIIIHSVERIQPAPTRHLWAGLAGAVRMAGLGTGWGLGRPTTMFVPHPARLPAGHALRPHDLPKLPPQEEH